MYSSACVDLVQHFEGLRLTAYQDQACVWTIGYGHTGRTIRAGLTITETQALAYLRLDLMVASHAVDDLAGVLEQGQHDALTSFTYNLGPGRLRSSTLLRHVRARDFSAAAGDFFSMTRWRET